MPSSSLVEVEVQVEVGVQVEVDVEVDATLSFRHSLYGVQILFWWGGWVGGCVGGVAGEMGIKANLNSSCS